MSPAQRGPGLTVTFQDCVADVEVAIDAETIAPTALHRELFCPDSPLVDSLQEALATIGPVTGGQFALIEAIEDSLGQPMNGQFTSLLAKTALQFQRLEKPRADLARKHWLDVLSLIRHAWNRPEYDLADVVAGPARLLGCLAHPPTLAVRIDTAFVSGFAQQQRRRLLRYLRRLTPGIDVRIVGSRLAVRKLLDHHAGDLPGDVTARARSALTDRASSRPAEQVAQDAIETLGLDESTQTYWRLLTRVCEHSDGTVPQRELADDLLLDIAPSTARKYAARFEELGLVERPSRNGSLHVRPTAAGQAALSMAQDQAPHLLECWTTGTHHPDTARTDDDPQSGVTDPPNASTGPCIPTAHERGGAEDRPTEEGSAAVAGGSSIPPPDCRFLNRHEHHAAAAAVPETGGIAIEERDIGPIEDARAVGWSLNEERSEVVVEAVASPVQAFTAVRLCDALFNEKALAQVLTPENLNGGPGKFDLEGLVVNNPYVLRKGRTLGWLRDQDAEGQRYLDRLRQARNELKELVAECAESASDGYYDPDLLRELLRKAHGLQAVLIALYDLLGYDVIRKLRVPRSAAQSPEELAHFITHQTSCSSRRGIYTAHRILFEERPHKRADALGTPAIGPDDFHGTVSGSWVIETPKAESIQQALDDPSVGDLELQTDEVHYQDLVIDVEVVNGHRRSTISELGQRLLPAKNLRPDREILTLLHALTGSPSAAGAVLNGMGAAEEVRRLDHGDLEYGLSTLVGDGDYGSYYDRYGERDLVPAVGGPTVSAVVGALVKQETPLSTADLAAAADVSTQSIRNNRETLEHLEILGFITIEEGEPGCADQWSFALPGVQDSELQTDSAAERLPLEHVLGPGWGGAAWRLDEAIHEVLIRLVETGLDPPVGPAEPLALDSLSGPPQQRDVATFIAAVPEQRWVWDLVARLLEMSLPEPGLDHRVRLGKPPQAAIQQHSLTAAVGD